MERTPKAARAERAARPAPSPRTGDSDPDMNEALRRVRAEQGARR